MSSAPSNAPNPPPAEDPGAVPPPFWPVLPNAMPVMISYLDTELRYQFNSLAYVEWLGRPSEELFGRRLEDITGPATFQKILPRLQLALNGSPVVFEHELCAPDGKKHQYTVQYLPDSTPTGHIRGVYVLAQDVTAARDQARSLQQMQAALEAKNREMESLLYATSHDLRSPLVNVLGFGDELKELCSEIEKIVNRTPAGQALTAADRTRLADLVVKECPECVHYIRASARKMEKLLQGLLQLSRLGRTEMNVQPVDMHHLVQQVLKTMEFQLQQASVEVEVAPLPACRGDTQQLGQVFSNLLDNAVKYLDKARPGQIRIAAQMAGHEVLYSIADNGCGIFPSKLESIFEPFKRVDARDIEGEGLGLAIVARIIGRHRGRVWVESMPGQGSTFWLALPATGPE